MHIPDKSSTCEEQQTFHSVISLMAFLLSKSLQRSLALRVRKCVQWSISETDQNTIFLFAKHADPFMVAHLIVFWTLIPGTLHTSVSCLYVFWARSSIKHIFPIIKWHSRFFFFYTWWRATQHCLPGVGMKQGNLISVHLFRLDHFSNTREYFSIKYFNVNIASILPV